MAFKLKNRTILLWASPNVFTQWGSLRERLADLNINAPFRNAELYQGPADLERCLMAIYVEPPSKGFSSAIDSANCGLNTFMLFEEETKTDAKKKGDAPNVKTFNLYAVKALGDGVQEVATSPTHSANSIDDLAVLITDLVAAQVKDAIQSAPVLTEPANSRTPIGAQLKEFN